MLFQKAMLINIANRTVTIPLPFWTSNKSRSSQEWPYHAFRSSLLIVLAWCRHFSTTQHKAVFPELGMSLFGRSVGHLRWIWHRHLCHRGFFFVFFISTLGKSVHVTFCLLRERGVFIVQATFKHSVKLKETETHREKQFFQYDGHLSLKRCEAFTCKR